MEQTSMTMNGRRPRISGLREVLAEACGEAFAHGRVFTSGEAQALVQRRFATEGLTRRDVNNALYRLAGEKGSRIERCRDRSGAYRIAGSAAVPAKGDLQAKIDQILSLLSEVAERVGRTERVEAKLRELGVRIDA